ncbi:MAG TPA: hypothetical protein VGL72_32150 [Bryobacteraceae bacterium]|jgi:hypothetical protein
MKMNFLIGFAVFGLALASAKSYEVSVDQVSKAGELQLQPGLYKVSVNGTKAKFTDENTGKSVETNVTVDNSGKSKFDATALETESNNGVTTIHEIDLGGTTNRVKFQ